MNVLCLVVNVANYSLSMDRNKAKFIFSTYSVFLLGKTLTHIYITFISAPVSSSTEYRV